MKKTLLLSALVASVASIAATTGSVEIYNKNETIYEKYKNPDNPTPFITGLQGTKSTFGVKTEVKVNESGLSFGADLKAEDLTIFGANKYKTNKKVYDSIIDHSSVWAKYELPELAGVMTYVKGTYKTEGKILVEADASYKVAEDIKVGLNSETTFNVKAVTSGTTVKSTHKVYAKGNYSVLKDIEAELGFNHDYDTASTAVKEVFLNAKASYNVMDDLKLTGEIKFNHSLNGTVHNYAFLTTGDETPVIYNHSYALTANYKGLKDTEITVKPFIEHAFLHLSGDSATNTLHTVYGLGYGIKLDAKYTGIENLVLSTKNTFAGQTAFIYDENQQDPNDKYIVTSAGFITLNANAEYTYKATDKLTVKPSLDLTSNIYEITKTKLIAKLEITPKVAVEYKPVESLTLSGDFAPVIRFAGNQDGFYYSRTTVKSNFNVKYTW